MTPDRIYAHMISAQVEARRFYSEGLYALATVRQRDADFLHGAMSDHPDEPEDEREIDDEDPED